MDWKRVFLVLVIAGVILGGLYLWFVPSQGEGDFSPGEVTNLSDFNQSEDMDALKSCEENKDCTYNPCGAFNNEADVQCDEEAPEGLYEDYTAVCDEGACTLVEK